MPDKVPPPKTLRRLLHCVLGALCGTLVVVLVGMPYHMLIGRFGADALVEALWAYLGVYVPLGVVAGIFAGLISAVGRWLWSSTPLESAIAAGAAAAAIGLAVTFGFVFGTGDPVFDIAWMLLVAAGAGWGGYRLDQRLDPTEPMNTDDGPTSRGGMADYQ